MLANLQYWIGEQPSRVSPGVPLVLPNAVVQPVPNAQSYAFSDTQGASPGCAVAVLAFAVVVILVLAWACMGDDYGSP